MNEKSLKLCIIIPAYNEASVIGLTLKSMPKNIHPFKSIEVIVIDDGSLDDTYAIAKENGATVFRHTINRGVGAATGTGFAAARIRNADVVITFDADGQHRPEDIQPVCMPILENAADVVIGSRMTMTKGMPVIRKYMNWCANLLTYLLFGIWVTDSQSGFRAYSAYALSRIDIRTNRYEVCSEILGEVSKNRLRLVEVPIPSIYTDYSLNKGQKNSNSFSILFKLILRKLMR